MLKTRLWMGAVLIALTIGMLVGDQHLAPWFPFLFMFQLVLSMAACHELVNLLGRQRAPQKAVSETLPRNETTSTHLLTLGSNRYDFWRVAIHQFREHPVGGIGARGFRVAYLGARRSPETPARAH